MKEEKEIISYTLVIHRARKKLDLTLNEYCVADSIYHLSNNPESQIQGWCYITKENLGKYLDITPQGVWGILKRLIEKGLVEKNKEDRRYLRTTQKWYNNVILLKLKIRGGQYKETLDNIKKLDIQSKETLGSKHKVTLGNKYNTINKYNNNVSKADEVKFSLKEKLHLMEKDPKRHIQIIALYWKFKKLQIENEQQYQALLKRDLRPARNLVGFSNKQILEIVEYLENENTFKWTLESVLKYMGENLKQLKPIK